MPLKVEWILRPTRSNSRNPDVATDAFRLRRTPPPSAADLSVVLLEHGLPAGVMIEV